MEEKINKICRLCLTEENDLECIFDTENTLNYCEAVKDYIGFEVIQNEKLPSRICSRCSSELVIVVNFITKCRAVNVKLLSSLHIIEDGVCDSGVKEEDSLEEFLEIKVEKLEVCDDPFDEDYCPPTPEDTVIKKDNKKRTRLRRHISVGRKRVENAVVKNIKKKDRKPRRHVLVGGKRVGDKIKCDTCGLFVNNVASMVAHHRTHTGERPYKCPECDKCFGLKGTMVEHYNRLHRKNEYLATSSCICDICGKKCYKKTDLKVHMRTHTHEKPYTCKYCSRSFTQTASLSEHVRVHIGERSFSCHMCGKSFLRKTSLRRHLQVHNDDKKYTCHLCDKAMKTSQALKIHLGLHTSEKTHICEICGASFAQKGNLKSHILSKHSEKSGECKICKKTYSDLSEHNRKHSGDKPFGCDLCSKRFTCERSLKVHMKWHTEMHKFPCTYEECTAKFPTNRQLEYHVLKVHEKYAPYVCKICSKSYYRESDLKQHHLSSCKGLAGTKDIIILSATLVDAE